LAWFQIILFSNKLGPNYANLQSTLNKAKAEQYRRNTCINSKLMQINPKFQAYIIKNTHAYLHLSCIFAAKVSGLELSKYALSRLY